MKQAVMFIWGAAVVSAIWLLTVASPSDWQGPDSWVPGPVLFLAFSGVALAILIVIYVCDHWND